MDLNTKIQRKYYQNYAPQYLENRHCQRETGAKNTCKFNTQKQKMTQCKVHSAQCTLHS
jgi:hypothetical protein